MKAKNIIVSFWVVSGLMSVGMGFTMGYYTEFLRSAHLNEFWINVVNISFFLTIVIFEIPTGLFADIFGRKGSLLISLVLHSLSLIIYGFSKSFWWFVISEVMVGISYTFASGAFTAWLTDSLKHTGEKYDQVDIRKKNTLISTVVMIGSCYLGGLISKYGLNKPFFCGSLFFFIATIVTSVAIKETYFNRKKLSFKQYLLGSKEIWSKSIKFAKTDDNFSFVLLCSSTLVFAVMATNMQWPAICKGIGLDSSDNGTLGAFILIALAIGSQLVGRLKCLAENRRLEIIVSQLFVGLTITLSLLIMSRYWVLSWFLLHEIGRGAIKTVKDAFIQESITEDTERATLGSFVSMVEHLSGALGLLVSGLLAEYAGFTAAWVFSGLVLIIFSLLQLRWCKKKTD